MTLWLHFRGISSSEIYLNLVYTLLFYPGKPLHNFIVSRFFFLQLPPEKWILAGFPWMILARILFKIPLHFFYGLLQKFYRKFFREFSLVLIQELLKKVRKRFILKLLYGFIQKLPSEILPGITSEILYEITSRIASEAYPSIPSCFCFFGSFLKEIIQKYHQNFSRSFVLDFSRNSRFFSRTSSRISPGILPKIFLICSSRRVLFSKIIKLFLQEFI